MATAEGGASSDAVGKLIKLLAKEQSLSALEIAETLWLALRMEPAETTENQSLRSERQTPSDAPTVETDSSNSDPPPPPPTTAALPRANIAAAAPQAGVLPTQVLPVWLADPSMLRDPLAVMRALKPLLRRQETGLSERLDEPATVDGIARTQLCLPVLEPEQEPWFDLVLVVDRSASMQLWQRLVEDLVRIFKRYGAFRNLQVFDLAVDPAKTEDAVRLKAHPTKAHVDRPGHRPSELIEQRGRRIVIVLSDCAAGYWWNGKLLPMLQAWTAVMPVVVWQMLPEWMWARTALGRGTAVALSNGTPGAANQRLTPYALGRQPLTHRELKRSPLPVVTSEPGNLNNWGLMLAGDRRELTPGFLLPQTGGVVPRALSIEETAQNRVRQSGGEEAEEAAIEVQISEIAQARIERFLALSSPSARRLLVLLAAAPVITLPVMRLIRDSMMTDGLTDDGWPDGKSTLPVAEVFMSGLMQRLPEQELATADAPIEADLVQYDFVSKVRKLLLGYLPEVDTLEVVNRVSAAVEKQWSRYSDKKFRAFLTDPHMKEPALAGVRSFASVTAEILEPLGGDYADFVRQLRDGANAETEQQLTEPEEDDFEIPALRTLHFSRAEVREESPPIQMVMDEFTVATLEFEAAPETEDWLAEVADIEEEVERAAALIELAPQLEGVPVNLLGRVVKVAQDIESERERLRVFSALLPYLPDGSQAQMQELIAELERSVGPALVEFEFEVARVVRKRRGQGNSVSKMGAVGSTGWEVQRDRLAAYQFVESINESITLEMVAIPAGTFMMGSSENELERFDNEGPQHEVSVTAFCLSKYPVTQAQWRFVASLEQINRGLDPDPSRFKGNERPVERVSWYEAVEFCDRLSRHTGNEYRLPSEAQWEYACRAGTQSPFYFGDTISSELANYRGTTVYNGGPKGEYREETTSVEYFGAANAFGLCDMHGNVWEWCADHWHKNYEGAPIDGSAWPTEEEKASRVRRGGSWSFNPRYCRSATRYDGRPDDRNGNFGFRVCCPAPRTLQSPAD